MTNNEMLNAVNQDNRFEMLLFHLQGNQRFGINVLKVSEVIPCPTLTRLPDSHPAIRGVATLRGESISVIDLSSAIGRGAVTEDDIHNSVVIVTEINRGKQGLLVERVDRIVVHDWKDVLPPPKGLGTHSYASGVTQEKDELIQILDVERILGEINHTPVAVDNYLANALTEELRKHRLLVVDDSSMARSQIAITLEQLGLDYVTASNGKEAITILKESCEHPESRIDFVLSDIEMPEMDGYSLTSEIRKDKQLTNIYILLHTSLNGAINAEHAKQSGANAFLTKFNPDDLASKIIKGIHEYCTNKAAWNTTIYNRGKKYV